MNSLDIKAFDALVEEDRLEEAKAMLKDAFSEELNKDERGAAAFSRLRLYMELQNKLNEGYLKELEGLLKEHAEVDSFEQDAIKHIDTSLIRNQIDNL